MERFTNRPWRETPALSAVESTVAGRAAPSSDLPKTLRAYCKHHLPEYMVPAVFVPLAALPLTPNGKVDRRALPAPDWSRPISSRAAADTDLPATPLEEHLAALWMEILGLSRIGTRDNFFECGGDSLLGLRMVNRLRKTFGENISLVVVFEASTIHALAPVHSGIIPVSREARRVRRSSLTAE